MTTKTILDNILTSYSHLNIDFDIYIVANAQTKTIQKSSSRIKHAQEDEFFSRREFAEIASAIFYSFGFVEVFYTEIDFIKYIIKNNIKPNECLVYNLSRDGKYQGKKSLIPAFCDLYDLRYTGSNAFVISLLRNKKIFTNVVNQYGIHTPKSRIFSFEANNFSEILSTFNNQYVIIKNINESASIGMSEESKLLITDKTQDKFLAVAKNVNDKQVIVQEFISGIECEVFVFQYRHKYYALDPVQIVFAGNNEFMYSKISNSYDYTFDIVNSDIAETIRSYAANIAQILSIKDYARFDFRVNEPLKNFV